MAVTTTLKPGYTWKTLLFALACVVLGVWGIYDYVVKIPAQQEAHERLRLASAVADWLEAYPSDDDYELKLAEAREHVERKSAALTNFLEDISAEAESGEIVLQREDPQAQWLVSLVIFRDALQQQRRGGALTGRHEQAYELATRIRDSYADVEQPAKWDRLMQWAFILCLPFAPWLLWTYMKQKRRSVTLDDEGDLHLPGGQTWERDQIAGIDMSKWMAKSIAWVIHEDGRRFKLDDYIHRDMHLIVGALAHRFEPDQWTDEAKVLKPESDEEDLADEQSMQDGLEPVDLDVESGAPVDESASAYAPAELDEDRRTDRDSGSGG